MNIYQITLLAALAIILAIYILEKVSGVKILVHLSVGKNILAALKMLCWELGVVTKSAAFETAYIVMTAAIDATERAEQLWLDGELPKEDRADYATLMIAAALRDSGIKVTEQIQSIIDGTVALCCFLLPHFSKEEEVEDAEVNVE